MLSIWLCKACQNHKNKVFINPWSEQERKPTEVPEARDVTLWVWPLRKPRLPSWVGQREIPVHPILGSRQAAMGEGGGGT